MQKNSQLLSASSDVDVTKIMSEIESKRDSILNHDYEAREDVAKNSYLGYKNANKTSGKITQYFRVPTSSKKGWLSKGVNFVIVRLYYFIRNVIGEIVQRQEELNIEVLDRIYKLENPESGSDELLNSRVKIDSPSIKRYKNFLIPQGYLLDLSGQNLDLLAYCRENKIFSITVTDKVGLYETLIKEGFDVVVDSASEYVRFSADKYENIYISRYFEQVNFDKTIQILKNSFERLESGGYLIVEGYDPASLKAHLGGFYTSGINYHYISPLLIRRIAEGFGYKTVLSDCIENEVEGKSDENGSEIYCLVMQKPQ